MYEYDKMVENALRGVVREALHQAATDGLDGDHHFYITFRTTAPGVAIHGSLRAQFPTEMTIVLQHQFSDLAVDDTGFAVTLSFGGVPRRLVVPFSAVRAFADPSVKFGLEFPTEPAAIADPPADPEPAPPAAHGDAQVVTLDAFRRK